MSDNIIVPRSGTGSDSEAQKPPPSDMPNQIAGFLGDTPFPRLFYILCFLLFGVLVFSKKTIEVRDLALLIFFILFVTTFFVALYMCRIILFNVFRSGWRFRGGWIKQFFQLCWTYKALIFFALLAFAAVFVVVSCNGIILNEIESAMNQFANWFIYR